MTHPAFQPCPAGRSRLGPGHQPPSYCNDCYRDSGLGNATGCPVSRTGLQVQQPPAAAGGLDELLVPIPARTSPETQVDHNIATLPDHVHQAPAHDVLGVLRQARVPAGAVVDAVAPEPELDLLVDGQARVPLGLQTLGIGRLARTSHPAHEHHQRLPGAGRCHRKHRTMGVPPSGHPGDRVTGWRGLGSSRPALHGRPTRCALVGTRAFGARETRGHSTSALLPRAEHDPSVELPGRPPLQLLLRTPDRGLERTTQRRARAPRCSSARR